MMIAVGLHVYTAELLTTPLTEGQGHGLRTFMLKFCVKVFIEHTINLIYIWYDDRYRSEVSFSNTPTTPMTLRSEPQT